ncbi:MAG TPA: shikimate dehydrogenase [Polyangiaceae bacterium]|nr:shikimate dehydrogenase [Polyangiaceae bacterium]
MHQAGYDALGLDWRYVPFETEDLGGALRGMRALGIRGFGISMPFKVQIMPLLDAIDPVAERIGAVNTVVNQDGRLVGHNTDWVGATRALEEVTPLAGRRVLLLGAGGAARAVAHGLRDSGAELVICNRSSERAASLAAEVDGTTRPWSERSSGEHDVIVNATSLGMADVDPTSPLEVDALREGTVVMDIVYKPLQTQLVRAAAARGMRAIHGGRMLLHQAARQFELYTGREAPLEAMDRALIAAMGS